MCGPAIGIIAGIGGGIMSAMGSIYSGKVQANQYKAEEQMLKYQAQSQREAGSLDSWRKERENERLTGSQITAIAASGGDLSGSALDVIKESRAEGDLDKALIRAGMEQKARMSLYQADVAKMNAKAAKTGSMLSAGAGLINAFASTAQAYS